jgi:hypothetical protein
MYEYGEHSFFNHRSFGTHVVDLLQSVGIPTRHHPIPIPREREGNRRPVQPLTADLGSTWRDPVELI